MLFFIFTFLGAQLAVSADSESAYRHFTSRSPMVKGQIIQGFKDFLHSLSLENLDIGNPDNRCHVACLQALLTGENNAHQSIDGFKQTWAMYAQKGVLKSEPLEEGVWPCMYWASTTYKPPVGAFPSSKGVYQEALQSALEEAEKKNLNLRSPTGAMMFASEYINQIMKKCRSSVVKAVIAYPGKISGKSYEQGYVVGKKEAKKLMQEWTDQHAIQQDFLNYMRSKDEDFSLNICEATLTESQLRVTYTKDDISQTITVCADSEEDDEQILFWKAQDICTSYKGFSLADGLAGISEIEEAVGEIPDHLNFRHSNPNTRWLAFQTAFDYLLNKGELSGTLMQPHNRLLIAIMLYNQGILS